MSSFSCLLLLSPHIKTSERQQTNVAESFLKGSPSSAEEKAKSYHSKHVHNQLLFCAVTFVSEAFCECGCRVWHALIFALSHHSSFSHQFQTGPAMTGICKPVSNKVYCRLKSDVDWLGHAGSSANVAMDTGSLGLSSLTCRVGGSGSLSSLLD